MTTTMTSMRETPCACVILANSAEKCLRNNNFNVCEANVKCACVSRNRCVCVLNKGKFLDRLEIVMVIIARQT